MKTLLRTLGLTFGLSLTFFTPGHTQSFGTCTTRCMPGFTFVFWEASYQECCGVGTTAPGCPAGTTGSSLFFEPYEGSKSRCVR